MGQPSTSPSRRKGENRQGSASILIIEDNPTDVFLIREAIHAQGLNVELDCLENGEEAMALVARLDKNEEETCPSLVMLDINLPRTDGFEVLARIRGSRRCANVPVIIMTSSAASTDREKSIRLGATAYFQKPAEYAAFIRVGDLIRNQLK